MGIALGDDMKGDYSTLAQLRDPDGNLITLATPPAPLYPPASGGPPRPAHTGSAKLETLLNAAANAFFRRHAPPCVNRQRRVTDITLIGVAA